MKLFRACPCPTRPTTLRIVRLVRQRRGKPPSLLLGGIKGGWGLRYAQPQRQGCPKDGVVSPPSASLTHHNTVLLITQLTFYKKIKKIC